MAIGITNQTAVTLDNITSIANITEPMDFFVSVNHIIYEGLLFFILLFVIFIVIFYALQSRDKEFLINAMYSAAAVSILGFFLRLVQGTVNGSTLALVTDKQMWVFPILTAVLAAIIWATKEN